MIDGDQRIFFFVHLMKTGGTTFVQHIKANFPPDACYPTADAEDRNRAYRRVDELKALSPEQRRDIRVYCGHFPFAASQLVGADVTFSILREPVDRTVSFLRHAKRWIKDKTHLSLEEIYEDEWMQHFFIRNYQSRAFAMQLDEDGEIRLDGKDVDDRLLARAKDNLERLDVLGLTERYGEFLDEMRTRFGWRIDDGVRDMLVSTEDWDVSASFRARIAEENSADVEFYDHARRLLDERRRAPRTV
jgi:hypothetical protein